MFQLRRKKQNQWNTKQLEYKLLTKNTKRVLNQICSILICRRRGFLNFIQLLNYVKPFIAARLLRPYTACIHKVHKLKSRLNFHVTIMSLNNL